MVFATVFGLEHVLYLIIVSILFTIGFYLIHKFIKSDKQIKILIKSLALILLILIVINRISITYYNIYIDKKEGYSWAQVLPDSWCSFISLTLSLSLLFLKKDNPILHFVCYLGLFGGSFSVLYPYYIETQGFFDIRSITGLLHHTVMFYLIVVCIKLKYFIPTIKKFYYYPLGFALMLLFGLFEIKVLSYPSSMQLTEPLVSGAIITSWYIVSIASCIPVFVTLMTLEYFRKKRNN